MDYLVTVQKKRGRLGEELASWERVSHLHNKRFCQGLEGSYPAENGLVHSHLNWSSVDHRKPQNHVQSEELMDGIVALPETKMEYQSQVQRGTPKPCLRCMAGESGHINHIMAG